MTTQGVSGPMNPLRRMEASRACQLQGHLVVRCQRHPEDTPVEYLSQIRHGDQAYWRYYDFNKQSISHFECKTWQANAEADIEIRLDAPDGELLGTCHLRPMNGDVNYQITARPSVRSRAFMPWCSSSRVLLRSLTKTCSTSNGSGSPKTKPLLSSVDSLRNIRNASCLGIADVSLLRIALSKGSKNFVRTLEAKIHTYAAGITTEGDGRNRQVGLPTNGSRIDQRTRCTQNGTAQHVPPVMSIGIHTSPGHVGRDGIGRYTPFPSVTTHQKGGAVESYRCMRARKGVMAGSIGTIFLDSGFEGVVGRQSRGRTQAELPETFAILLY